MIDLLSGDASSVSSKVIMDGTSNLLSDTPIADSAMTDKTDTDDTVVEASLLPEDSTQPTSLSSMSFFDLVETIFIKKEDMKPIENVEQVPTNVNEESIDTATVSEEIPLLSTRHQPESEFLIDNNPEEMRSTSD
jgi:hypothetical protein